MKILAIQLANGYSSEARVLATMLGGRDLARDEALVIRQEPSAHQDSSVQFAQEAQVQLVSFDTGWRPGWGRPLQEKVASHLRLRLSLPAIRKLAGTYQPALVLSSQQRWDSHVATSVARHLGRPQVIHLHYNIGEWLGARVLRRLRTVDHVITVSDFIRDQVISYGVPPERVTTIRNTIPVYPTAQKGAREAVLAEFGLPMNARVAGIVARLDPGKGHVETIRAFSTIAAQRPDAHLIIAGDGELTSTLMAQARASGYMERIHFVGTRSDVPRILSALDIFVHPSYSDPCPLAVLEAAASGLPILAFADGGIRELVVDGETGFLAAPGKIDELTERFRTLLDNPLLRRSMGKAGRSRIATAFKPQDGARAYMDVLHRVTDAVAADGS